MTTFYRNATGCNKKQARHFKLDEACSELQKLHAILGFGHSIYYDGKFLGPVVYFAEPG